MQMDYRHEYISEELSAVTGYMLSLPCDGVYEEYHVVRTIERFAERMTTRVIASFRELDIIQRVNETWFDTDVYVRPGTVSSASAADSVLTNEPTQHCVVYSFQKMLPGIDMQTLKRVVHNERVADGVRRDGFREHFDTAGQVQIIISTGLMDAIVDTGQERDIVKCLLSHELRHIVEQYVLRERNTYDSRKNSMNDDFKNHNPFLADKNDTLYRQCAPMMLYLSGEEQRARVQQLWSLCQDVPADSVTKAQLTASYNWIQRMGIRERLKGLNDNFRGYVIAALRTRPFRVTHLLHSFLKALNDLKVQSVQTNYKALLVWGYYMNKHGYL